MLAGKARELTKGPSVLAAVSFDPKVRLGACGLGRLNYTCHPKAVAGLELAEAAAFRWKEQASYRWLLSQPEATKLGPRAHSGALGRGSEKKNWWSDGWANYEVPYAVAGPNAPLNFRWRCISHTHVRSIAMVGQEVWPPRARPPRDGWFSDRDFRKWYPP